MSENEDFRSVHVRITGRVQGVFYRNWTQHAARGLGLDGWVRNRRDGTVEAVFAGPADAVSEMLKRCEAGPEPAGVETVEIVGEGDDSPEGFQVRATA